MKSVDLCVPLCRCTLCSFAPALASVRSSVVLYCLLISPLHRSMSDVRAHMCLLLPVHVCIYMPFFVCNRRSLSEWKVACCLLRDSQRMQCTGGYVQCWSSERSFACSRESDRHVSVASLAVAFSANDVMERNVERNTENNY